MPVFISVFMGLRGMANAPVESLRTGGMLWFTDLTLADQYFLLPVITSATLYLTVEVEYFPVYLFYYIIMITKVYSMS